MTDTSKAPERIWAWPWEKSPDRGQWSIYSDLQGETEYVRADLHAAQLAAAYEAAARAMRPMLRSMASRGEAAQTIRALTPEDARTALEQVRRDAFRQGMERAAGIVRSCAPQIEWDSNQDDRMHESIIERAARHIESALNIEPKTPLEWVSAGAGQVKAHGSRGEIYCTRFGGVWHHDGVPYETLDDAKAAAEEAATKEVEN